MHMQRLNYTYRIRKIEIFLTSIITVRMYLQIIRPPYITNEGIAILNVKNIHQFIGFKDIVFDRKWLR